MTSSGFSTLATLLVSLLAVGCTSNRGTAMLKPVALQTEYRTDPLGIDAPRPRLAWKLESNQPDARAQVQSAYRVLVASDEALLAKDTGDLWDSGRVQSSTTSQIEYAGKPLRSEQRAFWKVRTWDGANTDSGWSTPARFTVGLLDPTDWQAKWIGCDEGKPTITPAPEMKRGDKTLTLYPVPYLRKEFRIDKPIARATLYASALGVYEARLNGQRVGKDVLSPGWTDYNKRVHYQTYDVTAQLHRGENAMSVLLGDGWYAGYMGFSGARGEYGLHPRFIGQLKIDFADGTSQLLVSDSSWKASADGPIREADLLMGCAYDANREIAAWDRADFDDSSWHAVTVADHEPAALQASPGSAVQECEEPTTKKITEPKPGVFVFDLGQNMVGWVRMKLSTQPGQKIQLRYAEMLNPDGTLYTVALRGARATDTFTARGGEVNWEPIFTFHGFRYVELTGLDAKPSLDAIRGVVVHSVMNQTATFECSNPLMNQLVHNILWGQKGNYIDVPTDCPQRDERLGWTGDAQFFVHTAAYNFDVAAFFNKWLIDLCEDSANEHGAFACVAPAVVKDPASFGATAWADAGIVCPYTIWKVYGDTRVLRDHYAAMARYIDYLQKTSKDLVRTQGAYGDWVNLGGGASSEVIGTAYFEHVTRLMSEIAAAIGRADDSEKYRALADRIRAKFIEQFVTTDGQICDSSQTGYALAFAFNLLPADKRDLAAKHFVAEIEKRDWHLATGFIGTPILLPALSIAGRDDVAYRLLEQEGFPGWLFQVKLGATTMWERWDGWTPDKGFQTPGMNSFNHYAFGSVGEWLYRTVGGIDSDGPGFERIIIRPRPGGDLTWARTSFDSVHGRIETSWKIDGDKLDLDVTIPPNTTAGIHVPTSDSASVRPGAGQSALKPSSTSAGEAVFTVGSGKYHFVAKR